MGRGFLVMAGSKPERRTGDGDFGADGALGAPGFWERSAVLTGATSGRFRDGGVPWPGRLSVGLFAADCGPRGAAGWGTADFFVFPSGFFFTLAGAALFGRLFGFAFGCGGTGLRTSDRLASRDSRLTGVRLFWRGGRGGRSGLGRISNTSMG